MWFCVLEIIINFSFTIMLLSASELRVKFSPQFPRCNSLCIPCSGLLWIRWEAVKRPWSFLLSDESWTAQPLDCCCTSTTALSKSRWKRSTTCFCNLLELPRTRMAEGFWRLKRGFYMVNKGSEKGLCKSTLLDAPGTKVLLQLRSDMKIPECSSIIITS